MTKNEYIDLRSDTVTKPTKAMLEAMFLAEVGDDVFGEDPTINALEKKSAELFGMEEGLFLPSGTMANQVAIRLQTQLQEEILCDKLSHIYYYEGGGTFSNSGVSMRLLEGDRGRITSEQVSDNINDPASSYLPLSSLVCLENTSNKGGGSYYELNEIKKIRRVCNENKLKLHIDGARIFNALAETGESPDEYGKCADTLSFCFSKGLGAPVGSMLLSSKENIFKARRIRKAFGGGMRQAGYLAAACIYAMNEHVQRLKEDHLRARKLGEVLSCCAWVEGVLPVDTNIIIFRLPVDIPVKKILDELLRFHIKTVPFGKHEIRMVTHLDYDDQLLDQTMQALQSISI